MSRWLAFLAGVLVGLTIQALRAAEVPAPGPHHPTEQAAYNSRMRQR